MASTIFRNPTESSGEAKKIVGKLPEGSEAQKKIIL